MAKFNRDIILSYLENLCALETYIQNSKAYVLKLQDRLESLHQRIETIQYGLSDKPSLLHEISFWGIILFVISFPLYAIAHSMMELYFKIYDSGSVLGTLGTLAIAILTLTVWLLAFLTRIVGVAWFFISIITGIRKYRKKKESYRSFKYEEENGELLKLQNNAMQTQEIINSTQSWIKKALEIRDKLYNENIIAQNYRSVKTIEYLVYYCSKSADKVVDIDDALIQMGIEDIQNAIPIIEEEIGIQNDLFRRVSETQNIAENDIHKLRIDLSDELSNISDSLMQKEKNLSIINNISEAEKFLASALYFADR